MAELIKDLFSLSEEELSRIYMNVFNTEEGKIVIEDLKNRCHFDISTVIENSPINPSEVIFKEGRRSVLLHILTMLKPFTAERKE